MRGPPVRDDASEDRLELERNDAHGELADDRRVPLHAMHVTKKPEAFCVTSRFPLSRQPAEGWNCRSLDDA